MTDFSNGLSRIINSGKVNNQSEIINIEMEQLVTFQDVNGIVNPSIVDPSDPEFIALKKNIAQRGLDHPITVRPMPGDNTKYQVLCGHHRVAACEELGMATIKALVKRDMSDDDAALLVATDNFNRKKNYKPSEKAKAYKMALDAMKRKTGRRVDGSETEGSSLDELALIVGEGRTNIFRSIRLNSLIPELLNMVDSKRINMVPAVELSYIEPRFQEIIYRVVFEEDPDATINAAQARELRSKAERSDLTESKIRATLGFGTKRKYNPFNRKVKRLIPESLTTPEEISEYLIKAITFYQESTKDNSEDCE